MTPNGTFDPLIGVIIVSWNVGHLLARCLESVLTRTVAPVRIVVIDNASTDGSADLVKTHFPQVELIANADNRGFTAANNQGLARLGVIAEAHAAGRVPPGVPPTGSAASPSLPVVPPAGSAARPSPPVIALLNPDTEVAGDALGTLARHLRQHPKAGAAGPRLLWPNGTTQSSRRRFPTLLTAWLESTPLEWHWPNPIARRYRMEDQPEVEGSVDWLSGAALCLKSDALREVGGFDESFFMYSEELDLCRRLWAGGWEVHYVPSAAVVHHEGRSSEQVVGDRHLRFHRSRVRYFAKHHGRAVATLVRLGVLGQFALEMALEAVKGLTGHKADLRRQRVAMYARLLRDGLSPARAGRA